MLQNDYTCLPNTTNLNGWVTKNVTYALAGQDYTGVGDIVININGSNINLTNTVQSTNQYSSTCSKLSSYSWLGGYGVFGYSSTIIKTVFDLPPHQWMNIMFQAVLIDNWLGNTLLLQINSF
jgi:hypothetical protein